MMRLKIDIDDKYEETFVTIHVKEWTEEIEQLVQQIKSVKPKRIIGVREEQSILLSPAEMDYIYAENRKVFAMIRGQSIELKMKLYELEPLLAPYGFSRFSKSVIGNVNHIDRFELSFNGNLCVYFKSGCKEYVSRKYVQELKKNLVLGGEVHDI